MFTYLVSHLERYSQVKFQTGHMGAKKKSFRMARHCYSVYPHGQISSSPPALSILPACSCSGSCTHLRHYYSNQCRYSRKWIHYLNTQIQSDHLQIQCGQSVLNIGFEKQIGIVCSVNTAYVWFPLNLPIFLILIHGSPTIMLKTILVNYSTT